MIWRVLASIAFIIGAALSWFGLGVLHAVGSSQGGLSSGPRPASPAYDQLIPLFVCLYFVISAGGVLLAKTKNQLQLAGAISHSVVLAGLFTIASEGKGDGFEELIMGLLVLGILAVVVLSPWLAIWYCLLFMTKSKESAEPRPAPNGGPSTLVGNSGSSQGPPSVS